MPVDNMTEDEAARVNVLYSMMVKSPDTDQLALAAACVLAEELNDPNSTYNGRKAVAAAFDKTKKRLCHWYVGWVNTGQRT
jgi:hypothetical protein